jgi:hypothetical protein
MDATAALSVMRTIKHRLARSLDQKGYWRTGSGGFLYSQLACNRSRCIHLLDNYLQSTNLVYLVSVYLELQLESRRQIAYPPYPQFSPSTCIYPSQTDRDTY